MFRQSPSRMHPPVADCERGSLRYLLITQLLLVSSVAFGGDQPASCELASKSIVSRSSQRLAQVSNLGNIQITCRVPARAFPNKPGGEGRYALKVKTVASQISADGSKRPVPSEAYPTGGGVGGDPEQEWVDFYIHIPLEVAERDAEAEKYLAKLEKSGPPQKITEAVRQQALDRIRESVSQHRVGHFQVECRILDGDRVVGIGGVEVEVLFKGRFSDVGPPSSPPV
jgi:hypothetical protein